MNQTHHREILIGTNDASSGSRVGGRPPETLATIPPRCPLCGGALLYVLTLSGDLLSHEVPAGKAISLLTCRDYLCRAKSHSMIAPSSTLLIAHDDAPRATTACELDAQCDGRQLILGELKPDPVIDDWVETDASKIGGRPGYIQSWGPEEQARAEGGFLFQWSENTLAASDIKSGPYPFDCGVVYVFANPGLTALSAFWQS